MIAWLFLAAAGGALVGFGLAALIWAAKFTDVEAELRRARRGPEEDRADTPQLARILTLLGPHWDKHVVRVEGVEWTVQHALECRPDLLGCPIHAALISGDWLLDVDGDYLVRLDDDGELVLTALGA